jgi:hypothetical protein
MVLTTSTSFAPQGTFSASLEQAMDRLKKVVYKNRIRVRQFLEDFDKLRSGSIHINHFLSGLSMAGLDRHLTSTELATIANFYLIPKTARWVAYRLAVPMAMLQRLTVVACTSLEMVDYRTFINDVELIFTQTASTQATCHIVSPLMQPVTCIQMFRQPFHHASFMRLRRARPS